MPAGSSAMASSSARVRIALPQTARTVRWLSARRVVGVSPAFAYAPAPAQLQKKAPVSPGSAETAALEPGSAVAGCVIVVPGSCTAKRRKLVPSASDHAK